MNEIPNRPRRRWQFTLRAVLMLTLLIGVLLAWRSSGQRAEKQLAQQAVQLRYAEEELERARDALESRDRRRPYSPRTFWQAEFDGAYLRGVTIASPGNAFQRASLKGCDLESATLQGGGASFQESHFDNAKLKKAKLIGGGASFQGATFDRADLTDALLKGDSSAFQRSSFENAKLVGARLVGSFQGVNISGAHFERADLSALDSDSLASCYFKVAPTYDGQTKFPAGFDPAKQLWRRAAE